MEATAGAGPWLMLGDPCDAHASFDLLPRGDQTTAGPSQLHRAEVQNAPCPAPHLDAVNNPRALWLKTQAARIATGPENRSPILQTSSGSGDRRIFNRCIKSWHLPEWEVLEVGNGRDMRIHAGRALVWEYIIRHHGPLWLSRSAQAFSLFSIILHSFLARGRF